MPRDVLVGWVTLDNPNDVKRHLVTVVSFPLALAGIAEVISARGRRQPDYQVYCPGRLVRRQLLRGNLESDRGSSDRSAALLRSADPCPGEVVLLLDQYGSVTSKCTYSDMLGQPRLGDAESPSVDAGPAAKEGCRGSSRVGVSETGAPDWTDFIMGTGGP